MRHLPRTLLRSRFQLPAGNDLSLIADKTENHDLMRAEMTERCLTEAGRLQIIQRRQPRAAFPRRSGRTCPARVFFARQTRTRFIRPARVSYARLFCNRISCDCDQISCGCDRISCGCIRFMAEDFFPGEDNGVRHSRIPHQIRIPASAGNQIPHGRCPVQSSCFFPAVMRSGRIRGVHQRGIFRCGRDFCRTAVKQAQILLFRRTRRQHGTHGKNRVIHTTSCQREQNSAVPV